MSTEADRSQIPYILLFVPELHILTLLPDLFSSVIVSKNKLHIAQRHLQPTSLFANKMSPNRSISNAPFCHALD